ncbi:hypothetical protein [Streptomyces sp. NPDC004135]
MNLQPAALARGPWRGLLTGVGRLRLTADQFSLTQQGMAWRWVLTGDGESVITEHQVSLDSSEWQYRAFTDLHQHLGTYAEPLDGRIASERAIVAKLGAWITEHALGPVAAYLRTTAPVSVVVTLRGAATRLASLPWDLALIDDTPLSLAGVQLVMDLGHPSAEARSTPIDGPLRILALFSLPDDSTTALDLRRERRRLEHLVEQSRSEGRAVELRVLQYGVTLRRLAAVVQEDYNWHCVHLSGHGVSGLFTLEGEHGGRYRVTGEVLADVLAPLRGTTRLIVASACESAEQTVRERLLRLGPSELDAAPATDSGRARDRTRTPGMAVALSAALGCCVVGMRFPVAEHFASSFTHDFLQLMLGEGLSLADAVREALAPLIAAPPTAECPATSAGAVVVLGRGATDTTLAASLGGPREEVTTPRIGAPPCPPERFVGRVGAMTRAGRALSPTSGKAGVVLHGMAGSGKTSCAAELVHLQADGFDRLLWYSAPDLPDEATDTPGDFAHLLEHACPDARWADLVAEPDGAFAQGAPLVSVADHRLLVVVDGAETLLTSEGHWRSPQWRMLVEALTKSGGPTRLVLTSRRLPADIDTSRFHIESIHALSSQEALLLAQELPRLRALIDGNSPQLNAASARALARGVLAAAQGHPKLLELADAQAVDHARLLGLLNIADAAWRRSDAQEESGEEPRSPAQYVTVLEAWAAEVLQHLTFAERHLATFLAVLEPEDRIPDIISVSWPTIVQRLDPGIARSDYRALIDALVRQGLVSVEIDRIPFAPGVIEFGVPRYALHPAVASAIREHSDATTRSMMAEEFATVWYATAVHELVTAERRGSPGRGVWACRKAVPYLLRCERWADALSLLERLLHFAASRDSARWALPRLRRITSVVRGTDLESSADSVLSYALWYVDPTTAHAWAKRMYDAARKHGDVHTAALAAAHLIAHLRSTGRLTEALQMADEWLRHLDGEGRWTMLSIQAERLGILVLLGRSEEVLAEVARLREELREPPEDVEHDESGTPDDDVPPWPVWERLLQSGHAAAVALNAWEPALELNARVIASKRRRHASEVDLCHSLFDDHGPLICLDRSDEALAVLRHCRGVFERDRDYVYLARTLGALAAFEADQGNLDLAIELVRDALRSAYATAPPDDIGGMHYNLGLYLFLTGQEGAIGQLLAAALIGALSASQRFAVAIEAAAAERMASPPSIPPGTLALLCEQVSFDRGVRLGALLEALEPDAGQRERTYESLAGEALTAAVAEQAPYIAMWDTFVAGFYALHHGSEHARGLTQWEIDTRADDPSFVSVIKELIKVAQGERSLGMSELLSHGFVMTAVLRRAMAVFDGTLHIPREVWRSIPHSDLLFLIVSAGHGHAQSAEDARENLESWEEDYPMEGLVQALWRILGGERGPELFEGLTSWQAAAVETVLNHLPDRLDEPVR